MGTLHLTKKPTETKVATKKAEPKVTAKKAPKAETKKEVTLSELKVFADLIKKGTPCYMFSSPKVTLDGTKLTVGWMDGNLVKSQDPLSFLWDVVGIVTKSPSVEAMPSEGYLIRACLNAKCEQIIHLYKAPLKPTTICHENKLSVVEKVKWINEGKPCAYRYGFGFKGAKAHRISTGEAKERYAKRKFFEVDLEHTRVGDESGDFLVFCEYSEGDMW